MLTYGVQKRGFMFVKRILCCVKLCNVVLYYVVLCCVVLCCVVLCCHVLCYVQGRRGTCREGGQAPRYSEKSLDFNNGSLGS